MECEQIQIEDSSDAAATNANDKSNAIGDGNENNAVVSTSEIPVENHCSNENSGVMDQIQINSKPYLQTVIHRLASHLKSNKCQNQNQKKKKRVQTSKKVNMLGKRFKCDQCDYKSAYKYRIRVHGQVHSTETPFNCNDCDVHFKYKRSLKTHMGKQHNVILL